MNSLTAVIIDNREPEWVKNLRFGSASVMHEILDAGDIWALTSDNKILAIERKTPGDLLNTLKDDRLFPQMAGLQELRKQGYWPYLLITGEIQRGSDGKVVIDRETGWNWNSVEGALLTVQEMGVYVAHCAGDTDLEAAVIRLAERNRDEKLIVPPARLGKVLGLQESFLCGLPGIGPEKVSAILDYCSTPAWALSGLTDSTSTIPGIGQGIKNNVRHVLGLKDREELSVINDDNGNEILKVLPKG